MNYFIDCWASKDKFKALTMNTGIRIYLNRRGIAYTCLWLVLMQKSLRERKVVRDKCSQCAGVSSGVPCSSTACGVGKQRFNHGAMDSKNEKNRRMRLTNIYLLLSFSLTQIFASSSMLYSASVYVCSKSEMIMELTSNRRRFDVDLMLSTSNRHRFDHFWLRCDILLKTVGVYESLRDC